MRVVAIIADDLTSAMEGAGIFSRAGLQSTVTMYDRFSSAIKRTECTAVDLDSRDSTPSEAERLVESAAEVLRDFAVVAKTIDSTLRGHLVVETRAALGKAGRSAAIVAPAFPAQGRTTRSGVQYVGKTPVERSHFSQDPKWPVKSSNICEIFRSGGCTNITLTPASGIAELAHTLSRKRKRCRGMNERQIYVVDAETQDDLNLLCSSIDNIDQFLWVGTVGLLTALGEKIGSQHAKPGHRDHVTLRKPAGRNLSPCESKRSLVVVGSLNPASRKQLDLLREAKDIAVIVLDSSLSITDPHRAVVEAMSRFGAEYRQQGIVAVTTDGQMLDDPSGNISHALARISSHVATTCGVRDLVVTGGDTALKVLKHLGLRSIELVGEFELGMPVAKCSATGGHMITKAGGFGSHDTLVRACNYLHELPKP